MRRRTGFADRFRRPAVPSAEATKPREHPIRRYVLLFLLLSAVYHSNLRPIASGDSLPAALLPFSMLLDHSIALDRFAPYLNAQVWYGPAVLHPAGGHWYSAYPIAGSVLTIPLYSPLLLAPSIGQLDPGVLITLARISEKVAAVILASAAALVLLLLLRRLTSERAAWALTLVFALGTGNWSTASQALWQHTYGQIAIIGCLYAIEAWSGVERRSRWYWTAGLCAGCAVAIRPTNLTLLPALALALWTQRARVADAVRVFTLPALAIVLAAAYNLQVFGRLSGGYWLWLDGDFVNGLVGVLVSPGRGLFVYTPVVIFALAAFTSRARVSRERHRPLVAAAGAFCVIQTMFLSVWRMWWGGYCWGPRLMTEILAPSMVLIAIGAPALGGRAWKGAFAAAAVYGCLIQAIGAYCYPKGHWDASPVSVDTMPARVWNVVDNPVTRTIRGGFAWEPYSVVAAGISGGLPAAAKKLQEVGVTPY